jgi:hypothetical protein
MRVIAPSSALRFVPAGSWSPRASTSPVVVPVPIRRPRP